MGATRTFTDDERLSALLQGRRGQVEYAYELWRSDRSGELLEMLPTVDSGEVNLSNYRDHTWELRINMREDQSLDLFSDYVKCLIKVYDPDEGWFSFPMGLYRFDAPSGNDDYLFTEWDLAGKSAEALLLEDAPADGYKVTAGTGVLAAVKTILTTTFAIPATRIDFPNTDVSLAMEMFFSPFQDYEAARWLRICNALLAAGGFYALYTDGEGRWVTKEIETLADNQEGVSYGTGASRENLISGQISWQYSDESFQNKVVVYAGDANESPPVVGAAELHSVSVSEPNSYTKILVDPDSRFTYERYGRFVTKEPVVLQNIVSQSVAKRLAKRQLKLNAGMDLTLNLPTVPDPRRGPREVYRLNIERDDGTKLYTRKWRVVNWSMPLDLSAMTHEVSRNIEE